MEQGWGRKIDTGPIMAIKSKLPLRKVPLSGVSIASSYKVLHVMIRFENHWARYNSTERYEVLRYNFQIPLDQTSSSIITHAIIFFSIILQARYYLFQNRSITIHQASPPSHSSSQHVGHFNRPFDGRTCTMASTFSTAPFQAAIAGVRPSDIGTYRGQILPDALCP